jgi:hypothetical protein
MKPFANWYYIQTFTICCIRVLVGTILCYSEYRARFTCTVSIRHDDSKRMLHFQSGKHGSRSTSWVLNLYFRNFLTKKTSKYTVAIVDYIFNLTFSPRFIHRYCKYTFLYAHFPNYFSWHYIPHSVVVLKFTPKIYPHTQTQTNILIFIAAVNTYSPLPKLLIPGIKRLKLRPPTVHTFEFQLLNTCLLNTQFC